MNNFYGKLCSDNKSELSIQKAYSFINPRLPGSPDLGISREREGSSVPKTSILKISNLTIIGDIHLTEREDLSSKLNDLEIGIAETSDKEIVLAAFRKWGRQCATQLYGEFAFAIWDDLRKELFCARDHIGIRAFYYTYDGDCFQFASAIQALLPSGNKNREINKKYICDFLSSTIPNSNETIFKNIKQIPHGCTLFVSTKRFELNRYWEPEKVLSVSPKVDNEEIYLSLHETLRNAILSRITPKEKVGIKLSGGLDSSAIACFTSTYLHGDFGELSTFSKIPSNSSTSNICDESEYIDEIIQTSDRFHPFYTTETPLPNRQLYDFFFSHSYTFPYMPFCTASFGLNKLIQRNDIKTVLCGTGGDEFLSNAGTGVPLQFFLTGKPKEGLTLLRKYCNNSQLQLSRQIINHLIIRYLPDFLEKPYAFFRNRQIWTPFSEHFIHDKYIQKYDLKEQYSSQSRLHSGKIYNPIIEMIHLLQSGYHQSTIETIRGMDSMFSFSTHYPLLDRRLLEQCIKTPFHLFFNNGWKRDLIRQTSKGVVPEKNRLRKGACPFSDSFATMLRLSSKFIRDILNEECEIAWRIMNKSKIQYKFESLLLSNDENEHTQRVAIQISQCIAVASFLIWLEKKA